MSTGLARGPVGRQDKSMALRSSNGGGGSGASPAREERLAARLRENLKRRKLQARERGAADDSALSKPTPKS